jgi:hypothetical protein
MIAAIYARQSTEQPGVAEESHARFGEPHRDEVSPRGLRDVTRTASTLGDASKRLGPCAVFRT